eukprot:525468-Amphidinium_carterae.1
MVSGDCVDNGAFAETFDFLRWVISNLRAGLVEVLHDSKRPSVIGGQTNSSDDAGKKSAAQNIAI